MALLTPCPFALFAVEDDANPQSMAAKTKEAVQQKGGGGAAPGEKRGEERKKMQERALLKREHHQGAEKINADVGKILGYLTYLHNQVNAGKVQLSPCVTQALKQAQEEVHRLRVFVHYDAIPQGTGQILEGGKDTDTTTPCAGSQSSKT